MVFENLGNEMGLGLPENLGNDVVTFVGLQKSTVPKRYEFASLRGRHDTIK